MEKIKMKNLNKGITIFILAFIGLLIYSAYSFRHDFITKDVTLVASDSTSKYSAKYKHKKVYNEELGYDNPQVGDKIVVMIFTDSNPWLDGYYYKIITPRQELNNLITGKQLIDNKDTVYQTMHVASINSNDLKNIFN